MSFSNEQYVVNEKEEKVAIILPIEEYEKMKDDLHDLAIVAERRNEKTISFEETKIKMQVRGKQLISSIFNFF